MAFSSEFARLVPVYDRCEPAEVSFEGASERKPPARDTLRMGRAGGNDDRWRSKAGPAGSQGTATRASQR